MSVLLDTARRAVAAVRDPELPSVTIEELGILRDVRIDGGTVVVAITPTYSGCPAMDVISEDIVSALRSIGRECRIETVLSPPWSTDWMTESAKRKLLESGVAPPGAMQCPNCRSGDVETISEFGSTACQALRVCRSCSEPFPHFKPH